MSHSAPRPRPEGDRFRPDRRPEANGVPHAPSANPADIETLAARILLCADAVQNRLASEKDETQRANLTKAAQFIRHCHWVADQAGRRPKEENTLLKECHRILERVLELMGQPKETAGAKSLTPEKQKLLSTLDKLQAYLRRKLSEHLTADGEQKLIEELLAVLNLLARAEKEGWSNLAESLRQRAVAIDLQLPPEAWMG